MLRKEEQAKYNVLLTFYQQYVALYEYLLNALSLRCWNWKKKLCLRNELAIEKYLLVWWQCAKFAKGLMYICIPMFFLRQSPVKIHHKRRKSFQKKFWDVLVFQKSKISVFISLIKYISAFGYFGLGSAVPSIRHNVYTLDPCEKGIQ